MLKLSEFALLSLRLILAAVLLLAGATKLVDPRGTRRALRDFGLPQGIARRMMLLLPLAEITAAVMLIPVGLAWYGAWGALVLLGVFLLAVAVAMIRGRKPDCHCFGQLHSAPVSWRTIVRNAALAAAAGWLVWMGPARPGPDVWAWLTSLEGLEFKIAMAALCILGLVFFGAVARAKPRPGPVLVAPERELEREPEAEVEAKAKAKPELEPGFSPAPAAEPEPVAAKAVAAEAVEAKPVVAAPVAAAAPPRQPPPPPRRPVRNPMGVGLPIGAPAPDFDLPAITGERRSLRSLRDRGIDVLLIFSSPHCQSCESLAPNLVRWSRQLHGLPNVVIVSRGTPKENLAKLKEFAPSWVLLQRETEVSENYDVNATPSAVLVGADGLIRSELVTGPLEIKKLLEANARRKNPA